MAFLDPGLVWLRKGQEGAYCGANADAMPYVCCFCTPHAQTTTHAGTHAVEETRGSPGVWSGSCRTEILLLISPVFAGRVASDRPQLAGKQRLLMADRREVLVGWCSGALVLC